MCFNFRHLPAIDSCSCQRKMIWYWIVIHALSRMWTYQMPKHLAWLHGLLYKYGAKHVGAKTMWNTWKNVFWRFFSLFWCVSTSDIYLAIDSCSCQRKMIWYWIVIHALSRMWTYQMPKHLAWLHGLLYKYGAKHVGAETMWNTWKNVFWRFLVYFDVFQLQTSTSNW